MKTKQNLDSKTITFDKPLEKKPKSLRPMRSLVAVRSFKPKTNVALMVVNKSEEIQKRD